MATCPKCGAPAPCPDHDPAALVGATVDGFLVDALLGEGGMGVVYAATELATRRRVALKILRQASFSSKESEAASARFRREGAVLSSLRHPGIVEFIRAGI